MARLHAQGGAELEALLQTVRVLEVTRLCQVAAVAVTLYDHALSFGDEIQLIWRRPFCPVTFFYLVIRYLGNGVIVFNALAYVNTTFAVDTCKVLQLIAIFGAYLCVWATQLIMQLRLYAMYNNSKKLLSFTLILFVAEVTSIMLVMAMCLRNITYTNQPLAPALSSWHMCSMPLPNRSITAVYVPIFCYEMVMFFLALYAVFERMGGIRHGSSKMNKFREMVKMLFKYSVVYFLVYLIACAMATGMYLGLPSMYINLLDVFLIAASVLLGTRMVLGSRNFDRNFEEQPLVPEDITIGSDRISPTPENTDELEMTTLPIHPHLTSPSSRFSGLDHCLLTSSYYLRRSSQLPTSSVHCLAVAQSPSRHLI